MRGGRAPERFEDGRLTDDDVRRELAAIVRKLAAVGAPGTVDAGHTWDSGYVEGYIKGCAEKTWSGRSS